MREGLPEHVRSSMEFLNRYYQTAPDPDWERPVSREDAIAKVEAAVADAQLNWIRTQLETLEVCHVYDFGCGTGRLLGVLADAGWSDRAGSSYSGIDSNRELTNYAGVVAAKLGIDQKCVFCDSGDWLETFRTPLLKSAIVLNDVLHHLWHTEISHVFQKYIVDFPGDAVMIIAEVALLPKIEPNRVPLDNLDIENFASELGLCVSTETASGNSGIPLTRAVIRKDEEQKLISSADQIDGILRQTYEAKRRRVQDKLALMPTDESGAMADKRVKARIGTLELRQSIEYVVSHWSDTGEFHTLRNDTPKSLVPRTAKLNSLRRFIQRNPVSIVYGEFGVGKTCLIASVLQSYPHLHIGAVATSSSTTSQFVSWLLSEALARGIQSVVDSCRLYATRPEHSLDSVLESVSRENLMIVVDNAHLATANFVTELLKTAIAKQCRVLLIMSCPPYKVTEHLEIPCNKVSGFTKLQAKKLLNQVAGMDFEQNDLHSIWKECGDGNPQLLLMRHGTHRSSRHPESFGSLANAQILALASTMLQEEGLRRRVLAELVEIGQEDLEDLVRRGLLLTRGDWFLSHDIVSAALEASLRPAIEKLRRKLCRILKNSLKAIDVENRRLSLFEKSDGLRLVNQLRLLGQFEDAWRSLTAISYSIYMDGDYDRLLREIAANRKVSPSGYVPEKRPELFMLFLRQGRIYKRRFDFEHAKEVFTGQFNVAQGRDRLALLKELGEIAREEGRYSESLELLEEALRADEVWAKDERDKLITRKLYALTLQELGRLDEAEALFRSNLDDREPNDRLGIASCERCIGTVLLKKSQSWRSATGQSILESLEEARLHLMEALRIFEAEKDAEGLSGTVRRLAEVANLACQNHYGAMLTSRTVETVQAYRDRCLEPARESIDELLSQISNTLGPG